MLALFEAGNYDELDKHYTDDVMIMPPGMGIICGREGKHCFLDQGSCHGKFVDLKFGDSSILVLKGVSSWSCKQTLC